MPCKLYEGNLNPLVGLLHRRLSGSFGLQEPVLMPRILWGTDAEENQCWAAHSPATECLTWGGHTCQSTGCLVLPSIRRSATATLPVSSELASSRPPGSTCRHHINPNSGHALSAYLLSVHLHIGMEHCQGCRSMWHALATDREGVTARGISACWLDAVTGSLHHVTRSGCTQSYLQRGD